MRILIGLMVVLVAVMLYVRLAPTDVALWHKQPEATAPGDTLTQGSFLAARRMTAPAAEVIEEVEGIARATPRTRLLAGSVAEGMMTFQTRSRLWGFPDQTTAAVEGDLLVIYGRLRFGSNDTGVNKARIESWLAALGPLTEPL
jgi:uncharacterized protein (DUF1499 family)